jgi:hypothetical protein
MAINQLIICLTLFIITTIIITTIINIINIINITIIVVIEIVNKLLHRLAPYFIFIINIVIRNS